MVTLDFFKRISLFKNIEEEKLKKIILLAKEKAYPQGSFIVQEKEPASELYLIKSGKVKITKTSYRGEEQTLAVLGPADFFGEMAILDEDLRSATVEALTEVELVILSRNALLEFVKEDPYFILEIARILVKRLRAANQQISSMEKLQDVHQKILDMQEAERKRIARDIHDGPMQTIATFYMKIDLCKQLLKLDVNQVEQELQDLQRISKMALRDLRSLIFDLRPLILDTKGLKVALQEYIDKFQKENNILVHFNFSITKDMKPRLEKALFGIIQEGLNNIKKHAQSKNVWIDITESKNSILLTIKDDGKGFDVDKVIGEYAQRKSLGLISMKERAELAEGKFEISSSPNQGCTIKVSIPLEVKEWV